MYRYLAWMWNEADPEATALATAWTRSLEEDPEWVSPLQAPGLQVWHVPSGPNQAHTLIDNQGVVLGTLFRGLKGPSSPASTRFTASDSQRIVASRGRELVEGYWGRYVAFVRSQEGTWALRDPSGGLPCFRLVERAVSVFFLDLEDVLGLGLQRQTPNWRNLERAICVPAGIQGHETGLEGVTQILGGEVLEYSQLHCAQVSRLWNPLQIASESLEDINRAESDLRQAATEVVHAWASRHAHMLLALSGGLDSSIVSECLATAPSQSHVVAFNYFSAGANSDERRYARLAASCAGFHLQEIARRPKWDVRALLESSRRAPSPGNHVSFIEPALVEDDLANNAGASVIVTGFGGDQLFAQDRPLVTADYLRRFGWRPSLWRVAMDEARMEGTSVWSILRDALNHRSPDADLQASLAGNSVLMNRDVIEDAQRDSGRGAPLWATLLDAGQETNLRGRIGRGKRLQIQQLAYPPPLHNPLSPASSPEILSPLFSQPLVEICLRIPTYVHAHGGERRALARRAFCGALPPEIINRWTKGGYEEQAAALLEHNGKFVREALLDGELVHRQLLDRARLEEWLSGRPTRLAVQNAEIWNYVFYEVWLARLSRSELPESSRVAFASCN